MEEYEDYIKNISKQIHASYGIPESVLNCKRHPNYVSLDRAYMRFCAKNFFKGNCIVKSNN